MVSQVQLAELHASGSCNAPGLFHVELRQFPHVARAFNLTREELDARILDPWVREGTATLDGRRFSRERGKIKIYEGPELGGEQLGLGRGWPNVARSGEDATGALLADAYEPGPGPGAAGA